MDEMVILRRSVWLPMGAQAIIDGKVGICVILYEIRAVRAENG